MVVPMNMKVSNLSNFYIDMETTYWIGACNSFYQPIFPKILILHLCIKSQQVMMLTIFIIDV
jgi:hypothetical protein